MSHWMDCFTKSLSVMAFCSVVRFWREDWKEVNPNSVFLKKLGKPFWFTSTPFSRRDCNLSGRPDPLSKTDRKWEKHRERIHIITDFFT